MERAEHLRAAQSRRTLACNACRMGHARMPHACSSPWRFPSSALPATAAHLRQMTFSQLYLRARACSEGSMMPPRRRSTRCSVDSAHRQRARMQQQPPGPAAGQQRVALARRVRTCIRVCSRGTCHAAGCCGHSAQRAHLTAREAAPCVLAVSGTPALLGHAACSRRWLPQRWTACWLCPLCILGNRGDVRRSASTIRCGEGQRPPGCCCAAAAIAAPDRRRRCFRVRCRPDQPFARAPCAGPPAAAATRSSCCCCCAHRARRPARLRGRLPSCKSRLRRA